MAIVVNSEKLVARCAGCQEPFLYDPVGRRAVDGVTEAVTKFFHNFCWRVEKFAEILHRSGREAVEKHQVYRDDLPVKPFCEWVDLPENAREGRRSSARYLLEKVCLRML